MLELHSRSREGAWIEIAMACVSFMLAQRRSREGAWIEIIKIINKSLLVMVAPVRERGLKFRWLWLLLQHRRRSREGAWIEIIVI